MKRKPIDPYFYEVVGKNLQFEGTLYSMTPIIKEISGGKRLKCFPTICFHDVKELGSGLPFRQHVNVLVTDAMFNKTLFDNKFFIGDTVRFTAKVFYYESKKVNKRYNYRELSIGLKDIGNMVSIEGSKRPKGALNKEEFRRKGALNKEEFRRKGGMTTKYAMACERYNKEEKYSKFLFSDIEWIYSPKK